jgi:Na+/melibiose symporter-like transporter
MVKCPKCGAENADKYTYCAACGAQTQECCFCCNYPHPVGATFCPNSGENIADYKLKVERKQEVEKEFDQIFPATYRKECLRARFKAFFVSLICFEAVLAMIIFAVGKMLSSDEAINSSVTIAFAAIILIFTFAATGVSYERKRDEILDTYLKDKILGEKN